MECKNCGSLNPDDAVYCKNCGKRLDGRKNCPACGSVIEEDSVYCTACGARVDGKIVCKNCGTAHEGAYCPQCGSKSRTVGVNVKERASGASSQAAIKASKIINYVSLALVIAVAVLSIIFVCFTGVKVGSQEGESVSLGIFDYFGKEFSDAKDALSEITIGASSAYKDSLYTPAVLGLISVIIGLAGTVAFSIIGAVKAILNLVRKNGKYATVWALLAFVCYMFCASMIMSINAASVTVSSGASVSVKAEFNGATIAGIVLCTVMLVGSVGCDATIYFMKEKLNAYKIVERVLAVVVAVGAVIVVAMFASPVVTWINTYTNGDRLDTVTVKTKLGMGLLSMFLLYITQNSYQIEGNVPPTASKDLNLMEFYSILGQLCIFITIIAALLFVVVVLSKDGKKSRCLSIIGSSVFLAATLVALITSVLAGKMFITSVNSLPYNDSTNNMTYAPVIVALVFAVIAFAANICRIVFGVKGKDDSGYSKEIE